MALSQILITGAGVLPLATVATSNVYRFIMTTFQLHSMTNKVKRRAIQEWETFVTHQYSSPF